ncbi:MAG TPA: sialate O-acetylesterase [Thermodesulfobacteriaceae bacterium]|nr:sialate O-acetylesterase [Thermodesulfobacteriaceae bacterium]
MPLSNDRYGKILLVLCLVTCRILLWNPGDASCGVHRVACVGNSITYGLGLKNREASSYPARLGEKLGKGWEVRNFGISGAAMLRQSMFSYWNTGAVDQVEIFNPDFVIIMLGTNDALPHNWRFKEHFVRDYKAMIEHFKAMPRRPAIIVCLPVPVFVPEDSLFRYNLEEEVIPGIRRVADETGSGLIDLFGPFSGRHDLFPDRIHPGDQGADIIAEKVCSKVKQFIHIK